MERPARFDPTPIRPMKKLLLKFTAVVAAFALATPPLLAQQVTGKSWRTGSFTGQAATVATATTSTTASDAVEVPPGRGLAVLCKIGGVTAATNGAVTFTFAVSADGTTYSTDTTLQLAITATGTNVLTGFKNFGAATLDNVRYLRIASIQNASAGTVTNLSLTWAKSQ